MMLEKKNPKNETPALNETDLRSGWKTKKLPWKVKNLKITVKKSLRTLEKPNRMGVEYKVKKD